MPDLLADEVRKERQREYWRRYRLRLKQENPDQYQKMLERSRDWRRRNRKHCNEYNRNWSAAFPERRRKLEIRSRRKSTRRLSDGYVRLCLVVQQRRHGRMIRAADIPDSMVAAKRLQLKIFRKTQKIKKGTP